LDVFAMLINVSKQRTSSFFKQHHYGLRNFISTAIKTLIYTTICFISIFITPKQLLVTLASNNHAMLGALDALRGHSSAHCCYRTNDNKAFSFSLVVDNNSHLIFKIGDNAILTPGTVYFLISQQLA
jgi:hypothetical protein